MHTPLNLLAALESGDSADYDAIEDYHDARRTDFPCERCHTLTDGEDLDADGVCLDCRESDACEEALAGDPDFDAVCDARRDAWIAAMDAADGYLCDLISEDRPNAA